MMQEIFTHIINRLLIKKLKNKKNIFFIEKLKSHFIKNPITIDISDETTSRKHTSKYRKGYQFYVYGGPGSIEYFEDRETAENYQEEYGGTIEEMNIC